MDNTATYGVVLKQWEIAEEHHLHRGLLWYVIATLCGLTLLGWAIFNRNFLFAFIILMFAIVVISHALRETRPYQLAIHEAGVRLSTRFFPWKELQKFWIIEEGDFKALALEFSSWRPRLLLPLEGQDPTQIRGFLQSYLQEDQTHKEEPLLDWLARVLKL